MYSAIMFDLDGTLIRFDDNDFTKTYIQHASTYFEHKLPKDVFSKQLLSSIAMMVRNQDPEKTQLDTFVEDFGNALEMDYEEVHDGFYAFYNGYYDNLAPLISPRAGGQELIKAAQEVAEILVVATNPLFPQVAAEKRVVWGGLNPAHFEIITSAETFHYAKPNPKYYSEICDLIDVDPKHCLMIGNDAVEDMIASTLGMDTFWVPTEKDRPPAQNAVPPTLGEGDLSEITAILRKSA